jgi:hypothetical protein
MIAGSAAICRSLECSSIYMPPTPVACRALDVAVMVLADVPKQHRLAKTVVGHLGEGARAGNRAAAVVEPLAGDVPIRNVAHPALRSNTVLTTIALLWTASGETGGRKIRSRGSRPVVPAIVCTSATRPALGQIQPSPWGQECRSGKVSSYKARSSTPGGHDDHTQIDAHHHHGDPRYLVLAILGWGGFAAFFSHPPLIRGRCLGCADSEVGPAVRIRFPPAASLQTLGPSVSCDRGSGGSGTSATRPSASKRISARSPGVPRAVSKSRRRRAAIWVSIQQFLCVARPAPDPNSSPGARRPSSR